MRLERKRKTTGKEIEGKGSTARSCWSCSHPSYRKCDGEPGCAYPLLRALPSSCLRSGVLVNRVGKMSYAVLMMKVCCSQALEDGCHAGNSVVFLVFWIWCLIPRESIRYAMLKEISSLFLEKWWRSDGCLRDVPRRRSGMSRPGRVSPFSDDRRACVR
jgi:hypothetical protein